MTYIDYAKTKGLLYKELKVLYKEKPTALWVGTLVGSNEKIKIYDTNTSLGLFSFHVPISEMGEKEFENEIPAQLLIRWLVI